MDHWKHLTEEVFPYWLKITPDREQGGVFTQFRQDGTLASTDKNIWFQGRALWSYAVAWRLCGQKQEYLDICAHIYPFLRNCVRNYDKLPYTVRRDGTPLVTRQVYYYSEMFAAMGCAQYARICPDPEVRQTAELLFDRTFRWYRENLRTTQELPEKCPFEVKTFGLHMAMLATAQFCRNAAEAPAKYDEACAMAVREMAEGGFLEPEADILHEHRALDGSPLEQPMGQISVPGHIYEAAWFVMCEGAVKRDPEILALGKRLLDSAMPAGFEKETLLIPTVCDLTKPLSENLTGDYLAWPQQEAVIAFRLGYELYGEQRYLELSRAIEENMHSYFARFGTLWIREILTEGGQPVSSLDKGFHVNGPFHYERYLLAMGAMETTGSILPYMA